MITDTIAAIATAPGEGSVSIVRLSGPDALEVADRVFVIAGSEPRTPSAEPTHRVNYGYVQVGGHRIDEALLLTMHAPRSYTCEDVVEIHGHGGTTASRNILRACLEAGARLAEPGEFTRRAFLNGRIDLMQAEAVLDLIRSQSDRASTAALEQLDGKLSHVFDDLYQDLLLATAKLEATLDFPEDDFPKAIIEQLERDLESIRLELQAVLSTWEEGHLLRDGALVIISGEPNVGKSTLLNALLKHDRAIVSDIPGTTRDSIEETLVLSGIPIRLVDTAGLRETEDTIEAIGIERTKSLIEQADLQLHILDASKPIRELELEKAKANRQIIVLNKMDLLKSAPALPNSAMGREVVHASFLAGTGLDDLKAVLIKKLSEQADLTARPHAVISERHRQLVHQAMSELHVAADQLGHKREELLFMAASNCRQALELLGQANGKIFQEELLDRIFSEFCIGK